MQNFNWATLWLLHFCWLPPFYRWLGSCRPCCSNHRTLSSTNSSHTTAIWITAIRWYLVCVECVLSLLWGYLCFRINWVICFLGFRWNGLKRGHCLVSFCSCRYHIILWGWSCCRWLCCDIQPICRYLCFCIFWCCRVCFECTTTSGRSISSPLLIEIQCLPSYYITL